VSVLVILLVGQAMASMDEEILVIAEPSLREDLHASSAELQLVLAMYTLAFAALVVTGARLGDVIGRRRTFLLGLGGFTLASLAGGLAPTPVALVGARALQGASAALMTPQVLSIIRLQFEGEARARAIGAYSMVLAAGVAVGQMLGGLLVSAQLLTAAGDPHCSSTRRSARYFCLLHSVACRMSIAAHVAVSTSPEQSCSRPRSWGSSSRCRSVAIRGGRRGRGRACWAAR